MSLRKAFTDWRHTRTRPDVTVRAYVTNLPSKLNLHGPLEARVDFHLIKS